MITKNLQLSEEREEQLPYESRQFPFYAGFDEISNYFGRCVPWHWHRALEFSWVLQGKLKVKTNHEERILSAGEGVFINSNFLHYYEAMPGPDCIYFCQVFDASVIMGTEESIFAQKYVLPVIKTREIELYVLTPTSGRQRRILEILKETQETAELRETGYEIKIRNGLSEIWLKLFLELEDHLGNTGGRKGSTLDEERMKEMMAFIQKNYAEKISLDQISAAAHISRRECLRCFQNILEKTPFTYLMEYRCRKAAELLAETGSSITEIGYLCGFSSPSYFTKIFSRCMGSTPGDFRKKYRQ